MSFHSTTLATKSLGLAQSLVKYPQTFVILVARCVLKCRGCEGERPSWHRMKRHTYAARPSCITCYTRSTQSFGHGRSQVRDDV